MIVQVLVYVTPAVWADEHMPLMHTDYVIMHTPADNCHGEVAVKNVEEEQIDHTDAIFHTIDYGYMAIAITIVCNTWQILL